MPALQDNMPSGKLNEMDEPPTRWQPRNDSHGCINRCGEGTGGICVEDSVGWKVGKLALVQREIMKYNTAQGHFAGSDSYLSIFLVFHPKAQVDHVQSLEIAGSLSWGSLVILERNLPGVPAWFVSGSCPARTRASGGQCDCSKGKGSPMCGSFLEVGSRFRKCAMTTLILRTWGIVCRIPVFTEPEFFAREIQLLFRLATLEWHSKNYALQHMCWQKGPSSQFDAFGGQHTLHFWISKPWQGCKCIRDAQKRCQGQAFERCQWWVRNFGTKFDRIWRA